MVLLFFAFSFIYCFVKKIKVTKLTIMIISFVIGYSYSGYFWTSNIEEVRKYDEKIVSMRAVLISEGIQKNKYIEYIADDVKIGQENIRSKTLIRSNKKYKIGDRIEFSALVRIPEGARNFNGFDYQRYLSSMNIFMICEAQDNANVLSTGNIGIVKRISLYLKNRIVEHVDNNLPQIEANILKASLIGDDYSIDKEIETMYKDAGMIHLLVVSGGHIALVILIFSYIIKKINIPRNKQNFLLVLIVIIYMFITGAEPSVLRAGIGAIIILIADTIGRQNDSITTISLVALLLLLNNPMLIYSIGFELSFLGVLGIILLNKPIEKKLIKVPERLRSILSVTISAQLFVTPILIYYFNNFSAAGLFSNILALPLMSFIMILGLACFIPVLGVIFFKASYTLIIVMNGIAKLFANIPILKYAVPRPSIFVIALYYVLVVSACGVIKIKKKIMIYVILCTTAFLFIFWLLPNDFEVDFIDVGHGDSILITTSRKKTILIDTGGRYKIQDQEYNMAEQAIIPFILNKGHKRIDLLILTHLDEDHMGGLEKIVETLHIGSVAIGENSKNHEKFADIENILNRKQIRLIFLSNGDKFSINEAGFNVLNPSRELNNNENNNSITIMLRYEGVKILFTGDLGTEGERLLLERGEDIEADILKVGHHGSGTSTSEDFINKVNPKVSIISVGKRFSSIPDEMVLERLSNTKILRTDRMGGIKVKIVKDKHEVNIKFFKNI